MKTMRDYTLELAKRLKSGEVILLSYMNNNDLIEKVMTGETDAMLGLGRDCLWEAHFCTKHDLERRKEFAELGLYWLNEVILNDSREITPHGQLGLLKLQEVANAYMHLSAAYYDWGLIGLPRRRELEDVIPDNKAKAWHYLFHGAKYSEHCAIQLVCAYLKGKIIDVNVKKAHEYLLRFLEMTKNSPRFDRSRTTPFFPLRLTDYNGYNRTAILFQEHGANEYAFELWSELKLLIESQESYDLTPVKVNGAEAIYYNLAWCYCDGIGTTPNHNKAKELFAKAKELYEEENPGEDYLEEDKRADNLAEKLGLL